MSLSEHQYLKQILLSPVYDVATHSELNYLGQLSSDLNCQIWLKREDQQAVKSFKLRGAYQKISSLSEAQLSKGIVTASAGNHAQGVAYSAHSKQIHATIVMPETTPEIKVEAVKRFGGQQVTIELHGSNFDQASSHAQFLAEQHQLTYIPPFDDPQVIIGQGTIGKEILEQLPELDMIFIAIGGGGLAAGISVYLKQLNPQIRIIGVESEESACFKAALEQGTPVVLEQVGIFADGVAVKRMGDETFRLCQQHVDEVITVSNDEICTAIKDIFEDTRVIAEPAGALSVAGINKYALTNNIANKRIAGVLCGANTNFHTLRYVSERCELGEQKEAIIAVKIPEREGAFKTFCQQLGGRGITEFNYRFADDDEAHIFVGIKLRHGAAEFAGIMQNLQANGYQCFDLSDNETAKLHVRYMVGGRPTKVLNEKLYSFEFPEYPGALMTFLTTLGGRWNISLFHYRNHGAAKGLVLAGFEVPDEQMDDFNQHLNALGYHFQQETDNPAYQFFLSGSNV